MAERRAWLLTKAFLGSACWRVLVLRETPKRYRVRLLKRTALPRGWRDAGTEVWVPKHAVTLETLGVRHGQVLVHG